MSRAQQLVITGLTPDNLLSKIAWSFAAKLQASLTMTLNRARK